MPFKIQSVMEQKREFCMLAVQGTMGISSLCKRYNISRPTAYKWLSRYELYGENGLRDISKRPKTSPFQIDKKIEEYIVNLRKEEPVWGAKKLHKIIMDRHSQGTYPFDFIPSKSTLTRIFDRNGLINEDKRNKSSQIQRFEYEHPNNLWQMDFKGYFALLNRNNCYPLTILDDHSRFNIGLFACKNQQHQTVKDHLINVFRKYGLPDMILSDNGAPWRSVQETEDGLPVLTALEKWLILLDIKPIHGHPYHPQTQGKDERFHRTMVEEILARYKLKNFNHCQEHFDQWREKYNCKRPHEGINFDYPANRYSPSNKTYPEKILSFEYDSSDLIRKVDAYGRISIKDKGYRIGKAFKGDHIALRKTEKENQYDVYFCNYRIRTINTSKV
jgi:transposase InsO family protein